MFLLNVKTLNKNTKHYKSFLEYSLDASPNAGAISNCLIDIGGVDIGGVDISDVPGCHLLWQMSSQWESQKLL